MNYKMHYDLLIERARNRILECYTEQHRILPGCMGGEYDTNNVVRLTPEEHYVAHQLLVKIYPREHNLVYAANMMAVKSNNQSRNNKRYGWLKKRYLTICRARIGDKNPSYGKKWYHNPNTLESGKFKICPEGWDNGRVPKSRCTECNKDISPGKTRCISHRDTTLVDKKISKNKKYYNDMYNDFISSKHTSISNYIDKNNITLTVQAISKSFIIHVDGYVKHQGKQCSYRLMANR